MDIINQPSKNLGLENKKMMLFCTLGQGKEVYQSDWEGEGEAKQKGIPLHSPFICYNLAEWNNFKALKTVSVMLLKFMESGSIEHFFSIQTYYANLKQLTNMRLS